MLDDFFEILSGIIHGWPKLTRLPKMMLVKQNKGTDLGWIWSVLMPIMYIIMFYCAINMGFKSSKNIDGIHCPYFIWLATGVIAWRFIQALLVGGSSCITKQSLLLKHTNTPLSIYPVIPVFSSLYIHIIMVCVLIGMTLFFRVRPTIYWIQLPILMGIAMVFLYIWSFIIGMLHVISKDFTNAIRAISPAFFWLSGIFFNSRTRSSIIFMYNPITYIVEGYRDAICYNAWFWRRTAELKGFILVILVLLTIMLLLYRKLKGRMSELVIRNVQ